ncbi:type VII secretion target [Mycobacterium sp. MFM001]|uniref:type VII secretion target n=1 Tax=Mycobacterium sp. MFM001 TaxID=2049453 RepID=UPI000E2F547F|nr:type VII secretion target [Mycobacterium sp. MFM001]
MSASEPLRVTAAGLRALAQTCDTNAETLTVTAPGGAAQQGSPSEIGSACAAVDSRCSAAGSSFAGWTTALAATLTAAAAKYDRQDQSSADHLANQVV